VATGHLVAYLELSLNGHVNLDHFDDSRRKIITSFEFLDLVVKYILDQVYLLMKLAENLGYTFLNTLITCYG
jgi:hypothetical protein